MPESDSNTSSRISNGLDDADRWQNLQDRFQSLADEESTILPGRRNDGHLCAHCDYSEHPEIPQENKPLEGRVCLLKPPETGLWMYGGDGVDENFRERFRSHAVQAGIALGCDNEADPEKFWLHRLYLDMRDNERELLLGASFRRTDTIERVCKASATFCSRLRTKALREQCQSRLTRNSEANSQSIPENRGKTGVANTSSDRAAILDPLLGSKGFSVHDWARKARVDFHTANDYRNNKTRPYKSTLKKLADALGIVASDLPA